MIFKSQQDKIPFLAKIKFLFVRRSGRSAGFSLIELTIITVIMALLLATVVVNFRANEKRSAVRESAELVVSALRQMQNNILSGQPTPSGLPSTGYSVEFLTASPNIYATYVYSGDISTRQLLKQENLVVGVEFRNPRINLNGSYTNLSRLELEFTSPFGEIYTLTNLGSGVFVSCKSISLGDMLIDVVNVSSGFSRTIDINCYTGRITIL